MLSGRKYITQEQPSNKLTLQVTFTAPPTSPLAVVPNLKYNKKNWFSFEMDDMSTSIPTALSTLGGLSYTDGCGNNKPYTFGMAINGGNPFNGVEYPLDGNGGTQATKAQIQAVVDAGGDLSDHSYWHDPTGYGAGVTALQNTTLCADFIYRLFNGYQTRTKIVPNNHAGHAQAAFDSGYLYSTSEGTFDTFTPVGEYTPIGDFSLVPTFGALRRGFTDTWSASLSDQKAVIDNLKTKTNWFYRLGSHNIDNSTAFTNFFNYVQTTANDEFLVATTREIFEYREMKALPITQNLVGNVLTVEVDMATLSTKNRWKDLSFMITGGTIASVTTNATSSSFNATTGLVNIFKQTY